MPMGAERFICQFIIVKNILIETQTKICHHLFKSMQMEWIMFALRRNALSTKTIFDNLLSVSIRVHYMISVLTSCDKLATLKHVNAQIILQVFSFSVYRLIDDNVHTSSHSNHEGIKFAILLSSNERRNIDSLRSTTNSFDVKRFRAITKWNATSCEW